MTRSQALRQIHDALAQRQFRRDRSRGARAFVGQIQCIDRPLDVAVTVTDLDFVKSPSVEVLNTGQLPRQTLPHVNPADSTICYFDRATAVLDRYHPGGTVLWCLEQAEKVINDAALGRSERDFAAEFFSYWNPKGGFFYDSLPPDFSGAAVRHMVKVSHDEQIGLIVPPKQLHESFRRLHRRFASDDPPTERVSVIGTRRTLTVNNIAPWPPRTLADLRRWLDAQDGTAASQLPSVLGQSKSLTRVVLINGPNGCIGISFDVPREFQKPEFLQNRSLALARALLVGAERIKISRHVSYPITEATIFERNLGARRALSGKRILLIGCGAIGGFLGQYLAECGAGSGRGTLSLADKDTLAPPNLGRHLLGLPYLGWNKAKACQDFLTRQLPFLNVRAITSDVHGHFDLVQQHDLVVDATGEEAFSIALNDALVRERDRFPPAIFAWLEGNGDLAHALLCPGPASACYKCIKPDLSTPRHATGLKRGVETEHVLTGACSDGAFAPYPVSRPVQAAGLALELALDWLNGQPDPLFRTLLFNRRRAHTVQDGTRKPDPRCPACRPT